MNIHPKTYACSAASGQRKSDVCKYGAEHKQFNQFLTPKDEISSSFFCEPESNEL